jgi:hypothetical protein
MSLMVNQIRLKMIVNVTITELNAHMVELLEC